MGSQYLNNWKSELLSYVDRCLNLGEAGNVRSLAWRSVMLVPALHTHVSGI